jgi:hypothetical protein
MSRLRLARRRLVEQIELGACAVFELGYAEERRKSSAGVGVVAEGTVATRRFEKRLPACRGPRGVLRHFIESWDRRSAPLGIT